MDAQRSVNGPTYPEAFQPISPTKARFCHTKVAFLLEIPRTTLFTTYMSTYLSISLFFYLAIYLSTCLFDQAENVINHTMDDEGEEEKEGSLRVELARVFNST